MTKTVEERVMSVIKDTLGMPNEKVINLSDEILRDLPVDSLDAVEILINLEEEFGIDIEDEEMQNVRTVKELVELVQSK